MGAFARRARRSLARRTREKAARMRLARQPLMTYAPRSSVRGVEHLVPLPSTPAVDAHNHLGRWLLGGRAWMAPDVLRLRDQMDELGIASMVNLDGRWGDELEANLDRYDRAHPGRFATFCHVEWDALAVDGGAPTRWIAQLERSALAGACGIKVWKDLGLVVRDAAGRLVLPDDPRLSDVWAAAGQLGLPVLIHVADPPAFFAPPDRHNERLEEMLLHPDWIWHGRPVPSHARLLEALESVVSDHRGTRFIAAHVANSPDDLRAVSRMLDEHPNLAVDLAAREGEMARQPRASRRFLERHAERVLWGTDVFPLDPDRVRTWYRILETEDEYFPYSGDEVPPQGRWAAYGLGLPAELLARLYADNARSWIPALSVDHRA
jgi:hypothetical protein